MVSTEGFKGGIENCNSYKLITRDKISSISHPHDVRQFFDNGTFVDIDRFCTM
jgi:hypothetical protein